MTDRKFGNGGVTLIEKHPIIFYSHGLLACIFSFGLAIEVIGKGMKPELSWLWLGVPVIVLIQIAFINQTKSLWGILYSIKNTNGSLLKTVITLVFISMVLIILAFINDYI